MVHPSMLTPRYLCASSNTTSLNSVLSLKILIITQETESFDKALRSIESTLGYPVVRSVHQGENNSLRVVANPDWLRATSRDAQ